MISVLVLAGGKSSERNISLKSGESVTQALRALGYRVEQVDTKHQAAIVDIAKNYDVVFLALHGLGGEDGTIQKLLEDNNIKFVGAGSAASRLCFDKQLYSKLLKKYQINAPDSELVNLDEFSKSSIISRPFILKPNDGGSSIDNLIVHGPSDYDIAKIKDIFSRHQKMLLQNLVSGVEITVGILDNEILPVIEIVPPHNQEFDYQNKYNGQTQELCPPQHVSQVIQKQAQLLALKIHQLTGCKDMSRTDMIISPQGKIYVLETNTIPGMTNQSLLPKAASAAGYTMEQMLDKLIQTTLV